MAVVAMAFLAGASVPAFAQVPAGTGSDPVAAGAPDATPGAAPAAGDQAMPMKKKMKKHGKMQKKKMKKSTTM